MNALKRIRIYLVMCSLVVVLLPLQGLAQQNSDVAKTSVGQAPTQHDGQHDFDFEMGSWKIHLKRLDHRDEWNCSADKQGAAASESGRPMSRPSHVTTCRRITHIR